MPQHSTEKKTNSQNLKWKQVNSIARTITHQFSSIQIQNTKHREDKKLQTEQTYIRYAYT